MVSAHSLATGELSTTLIEIVDSTSVGKVTVVGLPTLGVGDTKLESLDGTLPSFLRGAIRR